MVYFGDMAARPRRWAGMGLVLLALLLAGCGTPVPLDVPKTASTALPPSDATRLGQPVAEWRDRHAGKSGFYLLLEGMDAFGARMRLIEEADRSIDAQYFLMKRDTAGALLASKLMRAADRGVRVRFLIDDVFTTTGLDPSLALMNSHPNVEIRLFNPISRFGFQGLNFLADFDRANRRMHNKSFTVDNVFTIVGGRNIADEYFRIRRDVEFADVELLGFGPVAGDVSRTFDLFWNSRLAVPMESLASPAGPGAYDRFRGELKRDFEQAQDGVYGEAVNTPFIADLMQDRIKPFAAPARVVTDGPEKLETPVGKGPTVLASELRRVIEGAREEVIILTPYFVPGRDGVAFFRSIRAKGVRVAIITNSLASTNHISVHSGYAPYRRSLLDAGIELYEVKVDALEPKAPGETRPPDRLTLHSKAVIVDRRTLFVGSLNLDPRSIDINTEMGLFLDAPRAAGALAENIEGDLPRFTYRLVPDDDPGTVAWLYEGGAMPVRKTGEPDSGFWRAFVADLLGLLPLESQL